MNAIEAMSEVAEERRILTISGERDELEGGPVGLISVQDLGRGFKPEDMARLFQPFYTTKEGGMGMGQRLSRSIVEAHGGRLWATSDQGQGARFSWFLPSQDPHTGTT